MKLSPGFVENLVNYYNSTTATGRGYTFDNTLGRFRRSISNDAVRSFLLKKPRMENTKSSDFNRLIQLWKKSFYPDDENDYNNNYIYGEFMDQVIPNCFLD